MRPVTYTSGGITVVTVADILAQGSASFTYEPVVEEHTDLELDQGIPVELSLWEAAERLSAAGGRPLPVVQDGKVVGLIRKADIVYAMQEYGAPD
ncbi:MAG TPA: CBS domain-containing protein [bacterium]|jgi:CBS domain-containing protein|nr:CBS domain-containing protein [bacterium]